MLPATAPNASCPRRPGPTDPEGERDVARVRIAGRSADRPRVVMRIRSRTRLPGHRHRSSGLGAKGHAMAPPWKGETAGQRGNCLRSRSARARRDSNPKPSDPQSVERHSPESAAVCREAPCAYTRGQPRPIPSSDVRSDSDTLEQGVAVVGHRRTRDSRMGAYGGSSGPRGQAAYRPRDTFGPLSSPSPEWPRALRPG